jgi:hypothetical protein
MHNPRAGTRIDAELTALRNAGVSAVVRPAEKLGRARGLRHRLQSMRALSPRAVDVCRDSLRCGHATVA